jgi:hypothetical protein
MESISCKAKKITLISSKDYSEAQIREQMSGPELHVFTLKFLALKVVFFHVSKSKKFKNFFHKKIILQLFSADAIVF